jgi:hypothetical protein
MSTNQRRDIVSAARVVSRVGASILGSYAFVWGFITLVTVVCSVLGMSFQDAHGLATLFAFLMYVTCFCWAFTESSDMKVWSVLCGGGGLMTFVGWLGAGTAW